MFLRRLRLVAWQQQLVKPPEEDQLLQPLSLTPRKEHMGDLGDDFVAGLWRLTDGDGKMFDWLGSLRSGFVGWVELVGFWRSCVDTKRYALDYAIQEITIPTSGNSDP